MTEREKNPQPSTSSNAFAAGFFVTLVMVFAVQVGLLVLAVVLDSAGMSNNSIGLWVLGFAAGWTQFLYLPILFWSWFRRGQREKVKGGFCLMLLLFFMTSICASSF